MNKSLDPNERTEMEEAVKGDGKRVGTQVTPSFLVSLNLRPLLLDLMIDIIVDEPILVVAVVFHYFFSSSSQCALGGEAPDWL